MALHPVILRILAARGMTTDEDVSEYLDPASKGLAAAESLPGIEKAAATIFPFLRDGKRIVVFGDYDADGVCASAILVRTLRTLCGGGAAAEMISAFIPDRFSEGYGMTPNALKRLFSETPDVALVITVDNGITSVAEVDELKRRGVAVVVTDHHLPGAVLPKPDVLVDFHLVGDSCRDYENLCGAGVAFFLSSALANLARKEGFYKGGKFSGALLVMAGLATVTDIVELQHANRVIAAKSIKYFNSLAPVGLKELLKRGQQKADDVTSFTYGFILGPRINAAGRIASAYKAYELLSTNDLEKARELAQKVDTDNSIRQQIVNVMSSRADIAIAGYEYVNSLVVANEENKDSWHSGVSGIVASRLLESVNRPVAIVAGDHGSARAPEGYNIHDALQTCAKHLERFGGHAAAGGFTLKAGALDAFKADFDKACRDQADSIPAKPELECDAWLESSNEVSGDLYASLQEMQPFGEGNEEPVFGLSNIYLRNVRVMGKAGTHLSFEFSDARLPRAVWWGGSKSLDDIRSNASKPFDVTFRLSMNEYQGVNSLQLTVVDLKQSK